MDFEVTILLDDHRRDTQLGEELLDAFLPAAPGRDVVVSQDADAGTARVWLMLAADEAASASQAAVSILRSLPAPRSLVPTAIHVDAASAHVARAA